MAIDGAHDSVPSGAAPLGSGTGRSVARLFVSGDSATSVIALATLRAVMAELPDGAAPEVIVIDVIQEQVLAFDYQVFVTPHLVVTVPVADGPAAASTMSDGLTDRQKVAAFLDRVLE